MNKIGGFKPFWVMFCILGVLLIGSFITPIRITLDSAFQNIEDAATANGKPELSCTDPSASGIMKATCWSLKGFMVMFVMYLLYQWVSGMVAGAKSRTPIFSPRYRRLQATQAALEA